MRPGAKALKQLRSAKVTAVECTITPKGKLANSATVKVGERTVVLKGAMRIADLLEEPMPADANVSPAAKRESERLQSELWALLAANPIYATHKERLGRARAAKIRTRRASNLAECAVTDGVPLAELLKLVEEQWKLHTIAHVMQS
ncbi:MAG: hypothetical protein ABIQ16_05645 [Polyangiaceae bacterium]